MENGYTEERKIRDGGASMESRYMEERETLESEWRLGVYKEIETN